MKKITFVHTPAGRSRGVIDAPALRCTLLPVLLGFASTALADEVRSLPAVEVQSSRYSLLGAADTANEGMVGQGQIEARVVARTGEVLEVVPGLIVSQHSGEGKANQYFLRGMNLDHGIDFRFTLDGMPINQRSHAHGQGWADLNFLIPELVSSIHYRKGPYYAAEGDFASAGAASISYADRLDRGLASLGIGQFGHARTLLANTSALSEGRLLYALELSHYDGPWDKPDDYRKVNGLVRYAQGSSANGFTLTAMTYSGRWNSTDQIPWDEYRQGLISRWGSMDTTSGAQARRNSLSGEWRSAQADGSLTVQAYLIQHYLDLYSNFEYTPSNQFNQEDSRVTSGLNVVRRWDLKGIGKEAANTLGVQLQNDNVFNGLYTTTARVRTATQRADHIVQSSVGLYAENHVHWNDWLRTVAGVRGDAMRFQNQGLSNAANTDTVSDVIASPKLNVVLGPWRETEFYYSVGNGFHSNDARGVTIGPGFTRSQGLVRTFGQEIGIRSEIIEGLQSTLALFQLDNASEIVYVGDEGVTEDSGRRSRRVGWEFNNYYRVNRWLTLDADLAYTRARFRDPSAEGSYVPGAAEGVASVAAIIDDDGPTYGSLQWRYFGPRPLTGDNTLRSDGTQTLNGRLGYRVTADTRIELLGFNLLNRSDSAIDYAVDSYTFNGQTRNAGPYRVFHPVEPRAFRLVLITRF